MNNTNGNDYVYPNGDHNENNLTKRELFAAMAMQGMLSDSRRTSSIYDVSNAAVRTADALIAELNKEVQPCQK